MPNERTPLLWSSYHHFDGDIDEFSSDPHAQFCMMVGVPSSAPTPDGKKRASSVVPPKSLYGRAVRQLSNQRFTYYMTASLTNTMLLSEVVLGAALTALGASESSHILITIFGAMNTIIAGLIAYLKSRGQPMRARMYRDDLERVVDEIENSEVMWLGISKGINGYDDIDTGDGKGGGRGASAVTVRSEVARLTRLYDRAVRNNTVNNPDMYMTGMVDGNSAGANLRSRTAVGGQQTPALPIAVPAPITAAIVPPVVGVDSGRPAATAPAAASVQQQVPDPDESPATAPPRPKEDENTEEKKEEETKGKEKETKGTKMGGESSNSADSNAQENEGKSVDKSAPKKQEQQHDPDAEPASDPNVPLKEVASDAADREN